MEREIVNVEFDGIDHRDYPDYCDAYVSYAAWDDGTPLSNEEIEEMADYLKEEHFWDFLL